MCRGCIREVGLSVLSVAVIDVDIRWWLSEVVVIRGGGYQYQECFCGED